MQTLMLENYGTLELSFDEMQVTDGGGQPKPGSDFWWGIAWEAVKYGWGKADEVVGNKGGSGAYHDTMSSSNHGGIRWLKNRKKIPNF